MIQKNRQGSAAAAVAITHPVVTGEGMVMLDESFAIITFDREAKAILNDMNEQPASSESDDKLPPTLLNLLNSRSQSEWHGVSWVLKIRGNEYTCRPFVVELQINGAMQKMIALYLKRELSVADAVHQIGQEYNLTDREQEALIGVSMGLTSKELATRMHISPNTVKAFVRLIMIKMGVTTRAGIVGKLLDQNNRHIRENVSRQRG